MVKPIISQNDRVYVYANIKTLIVFTAEELNAIENGGYKIEPIIGNLHNSSKQLYVAFNMSLKTAQYICERCQCTTFVWNELTNDGYVHSQYWEKEDASSKDYVVKYECLKEIDQCNVDGTFTVIREKFNFSIPFSTMERLNEKFSKNITQIIEQEQKRGNATLNREQILDFAMNKAGQSPMLYRKAIIKDC